MTRGRTLYLFVALAAGCAPGLRRFPLAPPLARDIADTRPTRHRPAPFVSADLWDFVDQSFFRRASRALNFSVLREATNVNAFDEVPDSSWYTDRLAGGPTADRLARGGCTGSPPDASGPWIVTAAKPNGLNPGFIARGPDGKRYLLKTDDVRQAERASAADAIAARIYHALGYFTPCNRILYFERSALRNDPAAADPAHGVTTRQIDRVLSMALRDADGRYRMSASEFTEGEALGPFHFEGTRADDSNDVVPHEDRREIRASRLVAAWVNHYDAREQNTFTSWIAVPGRGGYVRHWFIDFGDSFGGLWPQRALSPRSGHSYSVDLGLIAADFVTLGAIVRPWDRPPDVPPGSIFGGYSVEDFDPEHWRPLEPNPAFERMTESDAAWMARQMARLSPGAIAAMVAQGRLSRPAWSRYLLQTLLGRRRRILERYLTRRSAFADPHIEGTQLCVTDLATQTGIRSHRRYAAHGYVGRNLEQRITLSGALRAPSRFCVSLALPRAPDAGPSPSDPSRYRIVDLLGAADGSAPLRAHFYDLGPSHGYRLVGLERPARSTPPGA